MSGRAQRWKSVSAVALRLLLLVSLWRGPVLWGHEHSADCTDLATHLSLFHGGDPDALHLGWHWHLRFPNSRGPVAPDENSPFGDSGDSLPVVLSGTSSTLMAAMSSWAAQLCVPADPAAKCGVGASSRQTAVAAFGTGPGAAPDTLQLLCRMHC